LPPVVDLQADEPVGGNIVLPGNVSRFHLEADFMTGKDKHGEPLQITFQQVECPQQAAAP